MQTKQLADLLHLQPNTIRRWCETFHPYLSPLPSPPKGKTRVLTDHDVQVLAYIAAARDLGQPLETVTAHLEAMQADNWQSLPPVPPEWGAAGESMPVAVAVGRAGELVQVAVLQNELTHTQQALEAAQQRADQLDQELTVLRADKASGDSRIHTLELELSQVRGEVTTLQARLSAYALTGGAQPIPVALIVAVTAVAAVLVVLVVFVVARLVL
jgi:DNA-binding transcriptional MerR regulator